VASGVTDTTPPVATDLKCPSRCKVEGSHSADVRSEDRDERRRLIAKRLSRFAAVKSYSRVAGARGAGLEGGVDTEGFSDRPLRRAALFSTFAA
jgi:hypothetical protein